MFDETHGVSEQRHPGYVDGDRQAEHETGQNSAGAVSPKSTRQASHASLDALSESAKVQRAQDTEHDVSPVISASGTTPARWRSRMRSQSDASTISLLDLASNHGMPPATSPSLRTVPSLMQPMRRPPPSIAGTDSDTDGPPSPSLSPTSTFMERHEYGVGQPRLAKPSTQTGESTSQVEPLEKPAAKQAEKLVEKPAESAGGKSGGEFPADIKRPDGPPPPYVANPYQMPPPGRAERWMQTFGQLNQMGGMAAQIVLSVLQTVMQTLLTAANYAVENSRKR
jgi:hypothetical protein